MPLLLQDLAEETSSRNRRVADRLEAEARDLHQRERAAAEPAQASADPQGAPQALLDVRERAIAAARQATDDALTEMPRAEGVWRSALGMLRNQPTGGDAERLLRSVAALFESGLRIVRDARLLWGIAERFEAAPERLEELVRAESRFEKMAGEAKLGLEHRTQAWQPADPERLARGLQLAREGKTIKADEARTWFRRTEG